MKKTGSMDDVRCSCWRGLAGHTAPFVETARAGVAKLAGAKKPPQDFRQGIEQLGQIFCGLQHLGGRPVSTPHRSDQVVPRRPDEYAPREACTRCGIEPLTQGFSISTSILNRLWAVNSSGQLFGNDFGKKG